LIANLLFINQLSNPVSNITSTDESEIYLLTSFLMELSKCGINKSVGAICNMTLLILTSFLDGMIL